MTLYPNELDSDSEIIRIDNNITELGDQAINQCRDAIFAIEATLGINPQGSAGTVANRLDKSLASDGSIKASALTSIGLVSLPITNGQIASNAGVQETKLALDYSTSNLHTLILANEATLNSLASFAAITNADLLGHIGGSKFLTDNTTPGRHVASQVDVNKVPFDSRDSLYIWTGLVDKNGNLRSAATVADALLQINNDLIAHEKTITDAHPASAITVDTVDFVEIPSDAITVQKALQALDDSDRLQIGDHRQTMHSNGIPRHARSEQILLDGYSQNIVPVTPVQAFLVKPPATMPVDSNTQGDDIIKFIPSNNSGFVFDSQFAQVRDGDIVTIYYGIGVSTSFLVESVRFIPNSDYVVRINGINIFNTDGYNATARIDRPAFDINTYGVLAVASANNNIDGTIIGSVVVGNPRGAVALGLGFEPNEIDSSHYNLYLQLFPTGNPSDYNILLPAIDVSGNAGATPGQYTIDIVVAATNNALRAAGYNYRFIAFSSGGEFGIMLADAIGQASFAIINGIISGTTVISGGFINNVVGDASANGFDALGLGANKAALASPQFTATFSSTTAASSFYTKLIVPLRRRNYVSDGVRRDTFAPTYLANSDGYWDGYISNRVVIGTSTVETSYTVSMDLSRAGLSVGKTLVIQPSVSLTDPTYHDVDYGRFIIKSVSFVPSCNCDVNDLGHTVITVINGVHATANPISFSSAPSQPVRIYFSEDSVGFNSVNVIDPSFTGTIYKRLHEIYISGSGNTFSHERARMPQQTEAATLLATTSNWSIRNVSPKLRGFFDSGSSALNKYVRFYVLSYNSATGEYDGYIGKRGTSYNISNTGNITTARKNVPARFYDESNIDYIELQFFDTSGSTGTNILSTNFPRYVDIEVFPSLELDDENMLLATCELNGTRVDNVIDRRSFGNTSEIDFTQSAIDFINSGDKYLHENGIIKGIDFTGVSPVDSREMNFSGGIVLVNGKKLAINNQSVVIPEIRTIGATLPAQVTWAVCINETGQYEPIVLSSTKTQFFATKNGTDSFYVPSVTWNELITRRKDLVVVSLVFATINSVTLLAFDARRYVTNIGFNNEFILISDEEQYPGSFNTLSAVLSWVKQSSGTQYIIKVRGQNITLSTLDLAALAAVGKSIIFDGTDSYYGTSSFTFIINQLITFPPSLEFKNINIKFDNVAANFGINTVFNTTIVTGTASDFEIQCGDNTIMIDSAFIAVTAGTFTFRNNTNVKDSVFSSGSGNRTILVKKTLGQPSITNVVFENTNFIYAPSGVSYTSGDNCNLNTDFGCLIFGNFEATQSIFGLRIERCTFNSSVDVSQRPPLIAMPVKQGDVLDNIVIVGNKFVDKVTSGKQCAIAIVNSNSGTATSGPILSNSRIEHNECNHEQSILITSNPDINGNINLPGLHVINSTVNNNSCGNIGVIVSSENVFDASLIPMAKDGPALIIENNNCRFIANLNGLGNYIFVTTGQLKHNTPDLVIKNNSANWIHSSCKSDSYGTKRSGTLLINENKLQGYSTDYLTTFGATAFGVPFNFAILSVTDSATEAECRITNNTTDFGYVSSTQYGYTSCFNVNGTNCIITDNIFRGIIDDVNNSIIGQVETKYMFISGNKLERQANKVFAYIQANRTRADGYGLIVDNIFDSPTTNNSTSPTLADLVVVYYATCPRLIVERNINQSGTCTINATNGIFSIGTSDVTITGSVNVPAGTAITYNPAELAPKFVYPGGVATTLYNWLINLESYLPQNVKVLTVAAEAVADSVSTTTGAMSMGISKFTTIATPQTSNVFTFSGAYVPNTPAFMTIAIPIDTTYITGQNENNTFLAVECVIQSTGTVTAKCFAIGVLYRW